MDCSKRRGLPPGLRGLSLLGEKGCTGHDLLWTMSISADDIRKTMVRGGPVGETGQAKPVTAVSPKA
jgi:hypothetical protein